MEKANNNKYKILSITLIGAMVAIIIFVIVPKFSPSTPDRIVEKIDFSNPAWIEQFVEKSVGIFGEDFFQNAAFSYNKRSNKMIITYASQKSVEEARDFYLALPGAEQIGRNDETSLNITAEKDGHKLQVYNYYSSISRVFELELTLDASSAELIKNQLDRAFPAEEVAKISEIKELVSGEVFGGYVRYHYDDLDEYAYPRIPIYSRAYLYNGTEEEFMSTINILNDAYPDNKHDETQNTYYYRINEQIFSISFLVTDLNEKVVSISVQKN